VFKISVGGESSAAKQKTDKGGIVFSCESYTHRFNEKPCFERFCQEIESLLHKPK
jgi:hypothetical protein